MSNQTPNDLFIEASRRKLRFNSTKGSLDVSDLWDIPLQTLDAIAVALSDQIEKAGKKSFLQKRSASTVELDTGLEIAKYILETRVAENDAAKEKAKKQSEKEFLNGLLKEKQMDAIKQLTPEEIQAKIAAL